MTNPSESSLKQSALVGVRYGVKWATIIWACFTFLFFPVILLVLEQEKPGITRKILGNLDRVLSWEHGLQLVGRLLGLYLVLTFWCVIAGVLVCVFVRPKSAVPREERQHAEPRNH